MSLYINPVTEMINNKDAYPYEFTFEVLMKLKGREYTMAVCRKNVKETIIAHREIMFRIMSDDGGEEVYA